MKNLRKTFLISIFIVIVLINAIFMEQSYAIKNLSNTEKELQKSLLSKNKVELVTEIKQIITKIVILEEKAGITGPEGFKVYSPEETGKFIDLYQRLQLDLHYLNYGNSRIELNKWEGYSFSSGKNTPYTQAEVVKAIKELEKNGVPDSFINNFKVYLLPYVIPEVSGLGGAGYTVLSAQQSGSNLIDNQLEVTLDHEIGHHVHLSYMPKESPAGAELWSKFHQIRGGVWHGPGAVNTKAWGDSSEETFAEDFRLLFGKNQPFFGDISLGDPRNLAVRAKKEKNFMTHLAENKKMVQYESPWIPKRELVFWQMQQTIIPVLWWLLSAGIVLIRWPKTSTYLNKVWQLKV